MERGMTAGELLKALLRRRRLVGSVFLVALGVGLGIVLLRPSRYDATAVMRLSPQRPNEELVPHTVSELLEQRLLTARQQLLARPVLAQTIAALSLYPKLVQKEGVEAAIEKMREDLTVKVDGDTAVEVTYQSEDPKLAAAVANRLPRLFAETVTQQRQVQAARAADLFASELAPVTQRLNEFEGKLSQFKVEHLGELPEQLEMNMRGLERVGALMLVKSEELRAAEARRSELVRSRGGGDSTAGRLRVAEGEVTRELAAAQASWTPEHPQVQRLRRQLDEVARQRAEAEGGLAAERAEAARAARLVQSIQIEIDGLRAQARAFQARMENTPRWAHELAVLTRDYDSAKTKYQSLLSRKVEAELAQSLEARSAESMFNFISPAGVPSRPARPDRIAGALIALLAALGLGIAAGACAEMADDGIRDSAELSRRLPMVVLAVVPQMNGTVGERRILNPIQRPGAMTEVN